MVLKSVQDITHTKGVIKAGKLAVCDNIPVANLGTEGFRRIESFSVR